MTLPAIEKLLRVLHARSFRTASHGQEARSKRKIRRNDAPSPETHMFTLQDWLKTCSIRVGEFVNVHRVYVLVLFKMQPSDIKKPCARHKFQWFFAPFPVLKMQFSSFQGRKLHLP
ncbi:hypothetical protein F9K85_04945 [Brucella tritici]|uniref:Uncharacterized protein n=1 Tax=Brucella tritici TaxID=94626 RepID=A0A6L3YVQ4_9HYPH|nr:hypothetical protein F9K85_04945 [Brucella tritici]KAB2688953.1 hypothetical protein F9L08_04660 [Brucella tritici]